MDISGSSSGFPLTIQFRPVACLKSIHNLSGILNISCRSVNYFQRKHSTSRFRKMFTEQIKLSQVTVLCVMFTWWINSPTVSGKWSCGLHVFFCCSVSTNRIQFSITISLMLRNADYHIFQLFYREVFFSKKKSYIYFTHLLPWSVLLLHHLL